MRRLQDIELEKQAMGTLVELTGVFEGIASMRIAQIKNQVLQSTKFFRELWHIYTQLRAGTQFGFGRSQEEYEVIDKELFVVITAEGGLSGDIDQKLIDLMLKSFNKDRHEIIVIGHHGALQLAQQAVSYKKYYKMPLRDHNINVTPIINEVQKYRSTTVFYQQYVSLMSQEARKIELSTAVQKEGSEADEAEEVISEKSYIFEPSTYEVVDHLERSMMQIAVSQLILESKLAQYASRFRAMSVANQRAVDVKDSLSLELHRARRAQKDERLKETISGCNKPAGQVGASL